jgi:hypothetical protein
MSIAMLKTYRRMQLLSVLKNKQILRALIERNNCFSFDTVPWDEYWGKIPDLFTTKLAEFRCAWESYIDSCFATDHSYKYTEKYFALLNELVEKTDFRSKQMKPLISRLLGFENFSFTTGDDNRVFAGATTSFRNPVFVSYQNRGLRRNRRHDSFLLPLLATVHDENNSLFYHYRKQALITKTDTCVLFYPHVDINKRLDSFRGFEKTNYLFDTAWSSRIEERSFMITEKVMKSLLGCISSKKNDRSFRMLDIGSEKGEYISNVIAGISNYDVLKKTKIELSLLDIPTIDPIRYFQNNSILYGLSKLEYFPCEIKRLNTIKDHSIRNFDIVFLFRVLHHLSFFKIQKLAHNENNISCTKYVQRAFMSNYYRLLTVLFPETSRNECDFSEGIYHPVREFNKESLLLHDGNSIIEELAHLSKSILIEDSDLTPDILVEHISRHVTKDINVYDLTQYLRLSINHIFVILNQPLQFKHGTQIWPIS